MTNTSGDSAIRQLAQELSRGRVRLSEFFRDFDPLRSGTCVPSALKCVLTQLNVRIPTSEVDALEQLYCCDSGTRLRYKALLKDVETLMAETQGRNDINDPGPNHIPISSVEKARPRKHWENGEISVIMMLQAQVYEKRVGFRDHFRDFDHLHKGYISEAKLRCVLTILNFQVTDEEIDEIVRLYGVGNNEVDYRRLCDDVEKDLVCGRLEVDPSGMPPEPFDLFSAKEGKKAILSESDVDAIRGIERRIRARTTQQRINLLPHFRSFDHYNRLVITGNQFNRAMNTLGFGLDPKDLNLLQKRYCVHGSPARFAYRDFCASIDAE